MNPPWNHLKSPLDPITVKSFWISNPPEKKNAQFKLTFWNPSNSHQITMKPRWKMTCRRCQVSPYAWLLPGGFGGRDWRPRCPQIDVTWRGSDGGDGIEGKKWIYIFMNDLYIDGSIYCLMMCFDDWPIYLWIILLFKDGDSPWLR